MTDSECWRVMEKGPAPMGGHEGTSDGERYASPNLWTEFSLRKRVCGVGIELLPQLDYFIWSTSRKNRRDRGPAFRESPLVWNSQASRCLTSLSNISFQPCVAPSRSGPAGIPA